jgi:hypothetical protein
VRREDHGDIFWRGTVEVDTRGEGAFFEVLEQVEREGGPGLMENEGHVETMQTV